MNSPGGSEDGWKDELLATIGDPDLLYRDPNIQLVSLRDLRRLGARQKALDRRRRSSNMSSSSEEAAAATPAEPAVTLTPDASTPSEGKDAKEELVVVDEKDIGMNAGLKHLYSGKEDKRGRFQWTTKIPEDLGKPAEDADSAKWAILVRHVKVYGDPRRVLSLHSIVIQSPLLKELLAKVLANYPGVTVGLHRLEFSGQFEPLIHRWAELTAAIESLKKQCVESADEKDAERLKHAELLYELLADEFRDTIDSSQDMIKKGVMTYTHLWTAFQPGCLVYTKVQGQDRVFRLHGSLYGRDRNQNPVFWLTCQYVDSDGTRFGTAKINFKIMAFEGTKAFTNLAVLPFHHHLEVESLRTRLVERGSRVEALSGSHYRAYNGVGWRINHEGRMENHTVKGRIMVDTIGWNRYNPNQAVYVTALHIKDNPTATGFGGGDTGDGDGFNFDEYAGDAQADADEACGIPLDGYFQEDYEEDVRPKLTEEQKLICTASVRGYALKEKIWLNFFVNTVSEVSFNARAFESLVLPANQKELILGFTSTQQEHRNQFDDVIEGKGRGIILLLCGPPGVGKTLTAESVAEEMKVPLYMMSAGDLGLDPRHVESKLNGILNMCTRWNAILLLDEADVFLEERSLHELERNKLVSVFLRVLEYYEGIMFLTTNRVNTFDPAFQSRIHISIDYPELSIESRRTVWANFLKQHDAAQTAARDKPPKSLASADQDAKDLHAKRTLPHTISKRDLDSLSLMSMNGRQIKNILKTAQLLASQRQQPLSKDHVTIVMGVTQHLHNATQQKENTRSSIFS